MLKRLCANACAEDDPMAVSIVQGHCHLLKNDDGKTVTKDRDTRIVLGPGRNGKQNCPVSLCYITHQSLILPSSLTLVQGTREGF